MKKFFVSCLFLLLPLQANADLWGADLPLLKEIVFNTLHTMYELQQQSKLLNDELDGINDRIHRIQTIAEMVQPSSWEKWKDPREALSRIKVIYHNIPKEYRSEKYDSIEDDISKAMNLLARVSPEAATSFRSGKELERRGADASPGVAEKLTASGVGTLIALESQSQIIQSHITNLLAQMLADGTEKETRAVATKGASLQSFASNLAQKEFKFSDLVLGSKVEQ